MHFDDHFRMLAERLIAARYAAQHDIRGFDCSEVAILVSKMAIELPAAYLSFLAIMGKSAGRLSQRFRGTGVFAPSVKARLEIQRKARDILGDTPLRRPVYAIGVMETDQFLYFYCDRGEDPAIYRYLLGFRSSDEVAQSVTHYFERAVNGLLRGL